MQAMLSGDFGADFRNFPERLTESPRLMDLMQRLIVTHQQLMVQATEMLKHNHYHLPVSAQRSATAPGPWFTCEAGTRGSTLTPEWRLTSSPILQAMRR